MSKKKLDYGELLFLTKKEVESVTTYKEVLEACDNAFKWINQGKLKQEISKNIEIDGPKPYFLKSHGAWIQPYGVVGQKWGGICRPNPARGLPYGNAVAVLNDADTLAPIAFMDGISITQMRTAGHAAVGAKYLAKKNSSVIAIMGCGAEGRSHLRMMNELFKIKEVRAFDISKEAMDKYVKEMGSELKLNVQAVSSAEKAVRGADVVCMITSASEPVVFDKWIEAGTHVCATVAFADLDAKFSQTADKWVLGNWERDLLWVEGVEMYKDERAKLIKRENVYASLDEIANGKKPGRESDSERTIMTHYGMGALDVAAAYVAYKNAMERGVGTRIRLY